ncbi:MULTISPECIES: DUF7524 family protein [Salinibaculum]|uniref:DUF7524 family protein n=1 Tax=Salinibaculum TaxID=2732368 RepID=UPI0030CCAED9
MPDELAVHVSRHDLHAIEIPDAFETDGSFDVVLVNHGPSLHVHLHLDDSLSDVARLDANNHYVEGDASRAVRITVDTDSLPDDGVFGKLKVVSAYGSETRWVDVQLSSPTPAGTPVEVDESLSKPPDSDRTESRTPTFEGPELPVLALGGLALAVALLAAVLVQDTLVTVGAAAVFGGVLVALYVLVSG